MDQTVSLIKRVETPSINIVIIETSDNFRYTANLQNFSNVYCFPKDLATWQSVSIDSYGLDLVWSNRFEVHVDQVIACSIKKESIIPAA